jgi:uncharacterized protein
MRQSRCRTARFNHCWLIRTLRVTDVLTLRLVVVIQVSFTSVMTISSSLLSILACPEDKGSLYYIVDEQMLYNPRLKRSYPVRDDIPVMLVDESTSVSGDEHDRIMKKISAEKITPTFS